MSTLIRKGTVLLVILLLMSMPVTVFAVDVDEGDFNFLTTEDLYALCSVEKDDPDFVAATYACKGYIAGAVDYHDGVSDHENMKRLICYPEGTTLKEGQDAFVAWARENAGNPDYMKENPVVGLVRALAAKYPCKK